MNFERPQPIEQEADATQVVAKVFHLHPELAAIGTPKQYAEYVLTVFPESKFKEIVWHASPHVERRQELDSSKSRSKRKATYFGTHEGVEKYLGEPGQLYAAVLDLRNPYIQNPGPEDEWVTDQLTSEDLDEFRRHGHDGLIGEGMFGDKEILAFDSGQIHVLGTEEDAAKFRDFVAKAPGAETH